MKRAIGSRDSRLYVIYFVFNFPSQPLLLTKVIFVPGAKENVPLADGAN